MLNDPVEFMSRMEFRNETAEDGLILRQGTDQLLRSSLMYSRPNAHLVYSRSHDDITKDRILSNAPFFFVDLSVDIKPLISKPLLMVLRSTRDKAASLVRHWRSSGLITVYEMPIRDMCMVHDSWVVPAETVNLA
jgi:hypothetical protein